MSTNLPIQHPAALPPLGLYVHFPWCIAKCPYCDFNSHSLRGDLPEQAYIDALLNDLILTLEPLTDRTLQSVFLGGGTPSLFSARSIARVLDAVRDRIRLAENAEITMEANPGAIEHSEFSGYVDAGINRLSLGVQSFSDEKLRVLGRIHDADQARSAFAQARAAGIRNINVDLMYGLPGQSVAQAVTDLSTAVGLGPEHISWYHLTLEPNTVFYSRPPELPDEESVWKMQCAAAPEFTAAGFVNYEISAWCLPGYESRHNLNYWEYGDYAGVGAGAHAKLTAPDGRVTREARPAHPREYMSQAVEGKFAAKPAVVQEDDRVFEFMLNRLRLMREFSLESFEARTGLERSVVAARLDEAVARRLLGEIVPGCFAPTELGRRFLDDLQAIFLPVKPRHRQS